MAEKTTEMDKDSGKHETKSAPRERVLRDESGSGPKASLRYNYGKKKGRFF